MPESLVARQTAAAVVGMSVGLGAYFLSALLGAGPHLAGGIGGGVGAYCTARLQRLARQRKASEDAPTPCPSCGAPTWNGLHRNGHRDCLMSEVPGV